MKAVILDVLYYSVEGISILLSVWLLVTRFFGYPLRADQRKRGLSAGVFTGYVILGALLNLLFSAQGEKKAINGLLVLFLIIYYTIHIEENKWKSFFISVCAVEVVTVLIGEGYAFEAVLSDMLNPSEEALEMVYLGQNSSETILLKLSEGVMEMSWLIYYPIELLIIWGLSMLSSKRRKLPMAFSLVVAVFLVLLLMDNLTLASLPERYQGMHPFITFRILYEGEKADAIRILLVLSAASLLMFVCMFFFIKESEALYFQEKNRVSEYYLEAQKEHYERLTDSNREMRKIRHDMKNHAYCLRELYEKQRYEELGTYIHEMADRVELADTEVHTGNEIADAIISEKWRKAQTLKVPFLVEGELTGVSLSAIDTCAILANLIDNAMDAQELLPEEVRGFRLTFRKNENFLIITGENKTKDVVKLADQNVVTTKNDKKSHGYGLINIREAVERYGGECVLSFEKKEAEQYAGIFRIEVLLPLS